MVFAALAGFSGAGLAQGQQDGEALIAAGNEALEAGNYSAATQQFSRAMRSDTLSSAQIARALFLRGVAHKAGGKPAQAIADLDSALWLEGLSKKDMAQAYLARGEAYQAVGMTDLATADLRRAREVDSNVGPVAAARGAPAGSDAGGFTTQVEAATEERASRRRANPIRAQLPGFPNQEGEQPARAPSPRPEEPRQERELASFRTEVRAEEAPRPPPAPTPGFRTSIMPEERREAAPAPRAETPPSPQWTTSTSSDDAKERTASEGGARSTVTNFFSGLWGGSGDRKEKREPENSAAAPPQSSAQGWSQSTSVASAERAPAPPQAAPAPAATASSGGSGGYRIQLASLRTEEEAQAAWRQLSARHGELLAGQEHMIEKTTVGSLGTFYRIQIGPFTDKAESTQLCKSLQSTGVDCFLVAR